MRPLLIYHHIPKTGGTSLRAVVKANVGADAVAEVYGRSMEVLRPAAMSHTAWLRAWWTGLEPERRASIRCVAGHTANCLIPALDGPFRAFCLLRDPVERVWSLYHAARRHTARGTGPPGTLGAAFAERDWTLAEIYDELGGGGPEPSGPRGDLAQFFNGQTRSVLEPWSGPPLRFATGVPSDGAAQRDTALAVLNEHYVVGTQDELARSLERFAQKFKWRDLRVPYLNQTHRPSARPDARTRALILEHNQLDAEIHAHYRAAVGRMRPRPQRFLPQAQRPAEPVCILGTSRSGTSLAAGIAEALGVHLGTAAELMPAHPRDNPKGYWEHTGIVELNEQLLSTASPAPVPPGMGWRFCPSPRAGWLEDPRLASHRSAARRLVRRSFAGRPRWGWKDPRTCVTLPFWQQLVPRMRYVVCVRHPLDVAASLAARDVMPLDEALALWTRDMTAVVLGTSGRPRLFLSYEGWFTAWERQAERLARFLGADGIDEAARTAIGNLRDPRLRRHDCASSGGASLPTDIGALYDALSALGAPDAEPGAAAGTAVDDLARAVGAVAQV